MSESNITNIIIVLYTMVSSSFQDITI